MVAMTEKPLQIDETPQPPQAPKAPANNAGMINAVPIDTSQLGDAQNAATGGGSPAATSEMKGVGAPSSQQSYSSGVPSSGGPLPDTSGGSPTGGGATGSTAGGTATSGAIGGGGMINTPTPNPAAGNGQPGAIPVTTAVAAPNVTAPQGTSSNYQATTATGAGPVTAGTAAATNANVATSQVNPETDTVEGRTAHLIDDNSPLMQRAAQLARQEANRGGMLNSSAGLNAVQSALYDKALQIASPDAAEYSLTRRTNTVAQNQANLQNAAMATDIAKLNVTNALQAGIVNQDQANRIAQFNASMLSDASKFAAMSEQDMQKFNIANLLQAGIINQDQANKMSQFNAAEANAAARQNAANQTSITTANIGAAASMSNAATAAAASTEAARISAETSRINAELNANTARYTSDQSYKSNINGQKLGLANNIIQNQDFSPEYKQQLLNGLGPEFAALATATYSSVVDDLNPNGNNNKKVTDGIVTNIVGRWFGG